ncbi:MAG: hypothetical protein NVSMB42_07550 [Herpetosiphon sp.]
MLKTLLRSTVLAFILMASIVSPSAAAEPTPSLPSLKPIESGRLDFAVTINQKIFLYGKAEFIGSRVHAVAVDDRGSVLEVVSVGSRTYLRQDKQLRWRGIKSNAGVIPVSAPGVPTGLPQQPTVTRVGDATVGSTATDQFQLTVDPASFPKGSGIKSAKIDLFIGKSDGFVHKVEFTSVINDPQAGDLTLDLVAVLSDFNQPLVIGPPPSRLVDDVPTEAALTLVGGDMLSTLPSWSQPIFAQSLNQFRRSH